MIPRNWNNFINYSRLYCNNCQQLQMSPPLKHVRCKLWGTLMIHCFLGKSVNTRQKVQSSKSRYDTENNFIFSILINQYYVSHTFSDSAFFTLILFALKTTWICLQVYLISNFAIIASKGFVYCKTFSSGTVRFIKSSSFSIKLVITFYI